MVAAAACDTVPTGPIASWRTGSATWEDVEARVAADVRVARIEHELQLWELRSQALEQLVVESLVEDEAKKAGYDGVGGYLAAEIDAKLDPPNERDLRSFYDAVSGELGGADFESVAPMLRDELERRARMERYGELVEKLKKKADLRGGVPYPDLPRVDVPIDPTDPIDGDADALVTIVQFAEYQCPYCSRVKPTLDELQRNYHGRIRLVYKDFPLEGHARAMPAAVAAQCAGEQGKYWKMNAALLGAQGALGDLDLVRHAEAAGVDVEAWQLCRASGRPEAGIRSDLALGHALGVSATPTFFVNGVLVSGAQPYERFAALIDRELAAAPR